MRLLLQMLGGFFLFSLLITAGSCMYLGHVITSVASNPDFQKAIETDRARERERARESAWSPTAVADPQPVSSAAYQPGKPMLDPTPPGDRRPSWER